jgi:hypothetical protein
MGSHIQPREYYEKNYDRTTVEAGRRDTVIFNNLYDKFFEIMPDEPRNSHRAALHLNLVYMVFVGNHLLDRYDKREESIRDRIAKDEAKDERLAVARLTTEPICQHCEATGLRLKSKMLHYRNSFDEPEEVLFVLGCSKCRKNSAVWEDGVALERKDTLCPKCSATMTEKDERKGKILITTYVCSACSHEYKSKLDFTPKKEEVDPDFEEDRAIYCLHDEKTRQELRDGKWRFEEMARLGKEMKERVENQDLYSAVADLKRPKIAELTGLLVPPIEKAGFIEFSLGKPEMNKYVSVSFSCLDSKSNREDAASRKTLQKAIKDALEPTNWRLMSDGVSYRLGYLSGKLKAYESEKDLKELITKARLHKVRDWKPDKVSKKNPYVVKGKDGKTIIL